MKLISIVMLIAIVGFSVAIGQMNNKRAALNKKVAEEIKLLDREWLIESYSSTNDMSAFDRIVADDFLITHSRGKVLNKAQKRADIIDSHSSAPSPESIFKIEDSSTQVRVYKDVAISTGYIIEKYLYQGKQVNDRVYFTNTYLKKEGALASCSFTTHPCPAVAMIGGRVSRGPCMSARLKRSIPRLPFDRRDG